MVTVVALAAGWARAARACRGIRNQAEQARGKVKRKRGRAHGVRTYEKHGVRRPLGLDAAPDELERSAMTAGAEHTHELSAQLSAVVVLVVRRRVAGFFGVSSATASSEAAGDAL